MRNHLILPALWMALLLPIAATSDVFAHDVTNDYSTATRADYVFACMSTNGQTRQVLERCSCSIDVIASILPYERYIEAETVLQLRHLGGEKGSVFRAGVGFKNAVADLRRAQAEAEIRCF
ncbi:hypothetical protein [Pelagibius sp. Alg239-R121]|uniref:hypothetical protein n=1 Tax=Pelagibius sp. Alg239-R121 TaxID=2993448 RepID=UPI0024A688D8|nr:hypothetical protein [Pelagibius sp. Alg239-R121]